jgi:hypothetical protein
MSTSGRMQKAKRGRPSSGPPEERLNGDPHIIEAKENRPGACVMCKANKLQKETIYYCKIRSKSHFYTQINALNSTTQ